MQVHEPCHGRLTLSRQRADWMMDPTRHLPDPVGFVMAKAGYDWFTWIASTISYVQQARFITPYCWQPQLRYPMSILARVHIDVNLQVACRGALPQPSNNLLDCLCISLHGRRTCRWFLT